jgi:hypothetical protein
LLVWKFCDTIFLEGDILPTAFRTRVTEDVSVAQSSHDYPVLVSSEYMTPHFCQATSHFSRPYSTSDPNSQFIQKFSEHSEFIKKSHLNFILEKLFIW